MTKWLTLLLVIVLILFGYYAAITNFRVEPPWREPKFGKVTEGDIRVPITAAGLVRAKQEIEIKPEASGDVIRVDIEAGDYVKDNEILIVLDEEDEQNNVTRAEAEVERLKLQVNASELAIENAKVNLAMMKQAKIEAEESLKLQEYNYDQVKRRVNPGIGGASQLEYKNAESQYNIAKAGNVRAGNNVSAAEISVQDATNNKKIQQQLLTNAQTQLKDAKRRLSETTIRAPQEGIVTQVGVKRGSIVQSGTNNFTGGTVIASISDVSELKVIARVDESDYGKIVKISPVNSLPDMPNYRQAAAADAEMLEKRSGDVRITVDAFPDETFAGKITRIEPQGRQNPGATVIQFDVHVTITDENAYLLPLGAQALVEFTVESAEEVLRVPSDAVKTLDGNKGVWVKTDPPEGSQEKYGRKFVPCTFGISDGEYTEIARIIEGELTDGVEVYTKLPPKKDE